MSPTADESGVRPRREIWLVIGAVAWSACGSGGPVAGAPVPVGDPHHGTAGEAAAAPVRTPPVDTAALTTVFDSLCAHHEVPGGSAAVVLPDGREWTGACGIAAQAVQARPDHRFEIGSITKTYTAALVLDLVAEGRLALDDPVASLVSGVPGLEGVSVEHLLRHTSGLFDFTAHREYLPRMRSDFSRVWTARELLETFGGERLFAPGTEWSYSSTNYHLLGLIVEAVDGRSFEEALVTRVLDPHGLSDTQLVGAGPVGEGEAHAFIDIDGDGTAEDLTALVPLVSFRTAAWASGAITATALDVARWMRLLASGETVPEPLMTELLTGVERGDGLRHGLGVILDRRQNREIIGHKGNSAGFSASAWSATDGGPAVAVLTNAHATDVTPIALALFDLVGQGWPR